MENLAKRAGMFVVNTVGTIVGITALVIVCIIDDREARKRSREITY